MANCTNVEELAALTFDELDHRLSVCRDRVEERAARCHAEERDLTDREADLCNGDRAEMRAIHDAVQLKNREADYTSRVTAAISQAVDARSADQRRLSPLFPSQENLVQLERARAEYRSLTLVEQRAAIGTADVGTATDYGPGGLAAPNTLWRLSGIPTTQPPTGYKAVVPKFTLPAGVALVAEGLEHAEYDNVTPDNVTLGRAGAWSDLTAEAFIATSLGEISAAHARVIARNIDVATVTKLQAAATPNTTVDQALTAVAAEASVDVSRLWIVGTPTAIAGLVGTAVFTPTSGPDIESFASAYGGAKVYSTPAATADTLTVFFPSGYRAFATGLASGVVVDPTTGAQRFGQWMIFGLGQSLVGAAVTVAAT